MLGAYLQDLVGWHGGQWHESTTETGVNQFYFFSPLGGCGYSAVYGGNAENNVEFLLTSVFDKVDEYLSVYFDTKLTRERDGTNIIGFSDGGLFSCYAAWTRPKVNGAGSECQNEITKMLF